MARPMKAASPDEQTTVSIRMRGALRVQLEQEAAANHRTLSAEAERRIERSFNPEALLVDSVRAMEGPGANKEIADCLRSMASEIYGDTATDAGLAVMRLLSAREIYGERFAVPPRDIELCRTVVAALRRAIAESEVSSGARQEATRGKERPARLHLAVRDDLCIRLAMGEWKPNSPLPKESDLAREYGVSLETIREALALMESEGLLSRRPQTGSPKGAPKPHIYLVTPPPDARRA